VLAAAPATASAERVFVWRDGAVYRLQAHVGRVTDIALEPGETLSARGAVAAGDTARWIIGDSESGRGAARQAHVLVKPVAPGLETNLVIATDRRTYHLELSSGGKAWISSAAWRYPAGALIALSGRPAAAADAPAASKAAPPATPAGVDLARLSFAYSIEGEAPWKPVRVFDDGRRTAIDFPKSIAAGEMPPLFVTGPSGAPELVNYRVVGRRMIVDRIFRAAELRLGSGRRQAVVRLVRGAGA
jgi:type IV secretion system protein VirB9